MNKFMQLFVGSLLLGVTTLVNADRSLWSDFEEMEEHLDKQIQEMHKNIKALSKLPKNSLTTSLKEDDKHVIITISGIEAQELNATLNDNNDQLSISTPNNRIIVTVKGNLIGIETSQEVKELKEEKKDDTEKRSSQYVGSSYMSTQQTVGAPLVLEKQTIDYDHDSKELVITIPKGEVQKGKSVPIKKISKQKQEKSTKGIVSTPAVEK